MVACTFASGIKRITILAFSIVLCWSACGLAQVKVAVVPTTWNHQRYGNVLNPVLDQLGWKYDTYANTQLAELMPNLKQYNMVVFLTTYNFANTQDFGKYATQWKDYLEAGGCLVVTDANYDHQSQWLSAVDKRLALGKSIFRPREVTSTWMAANHPLMKKIQQPGMGWGQITSWAPGWVPLAKDSMDIPYIAYQEIGNGMVVVSTCYSDQDWPNAKFLTNLLYWAQSPERLRVLNSSKEEKIVKPKLDVPMLPELPRIDGIAEQGEWADAAEVSEFVDYVTQSPGMPETRCRIAQGTDDLYVLFECVKGANDSVLKSKGQKFTEPEREDCVEIFIDPIRDGRTLLHFAVSMAGEKFAEKMTGESWNRHWLAKMNNQNDRWTVEIKIPFTSLGITQKISPLTIWSANFVRRYHPNSMKAQAFVWAQALTQKELNKNLGLLSGIKVHNENYNVDPEMSVHTPEKWLPGDNDVRVDIEAYCEIPDNVVLALKATDSNDRLQADQTVALKDQKNSIVVPVKLAINGQFSGQFVLLDAKNPNRILASSPTIEADAKPLVEPELIIPAYRNIVQSKDPKKELLIRGQIEKADFSDLRFETEVRSQVDEKIVWQESQKVQAGKSFEVKTSLADWPVGKYQVHMTLRSAKTGQKLLGENEFHIEILPPANFEVTFDERRICYVNGKAIFPIGLYHSGPLFLSTINSAGKKNNLPPISVEEMLRDIKDHGFNTVFETHAWAGSDEQYLKLAKDLDLYVVPEIGALDENTFRSKVDQANRIGNILMWYSADEPDLNKIRYVLPDVRDRYQAIDPHRPVGAAIAGEAGVPYFQGAYDILMMDIYPFTINKSNLISSGGQMDRGLAVGKNRKPMWMVPQAFALDRDVLAEPTPDQLRAQAYFDIIHGSTGLMWYSYYESTYMKNPKGRGCWFLPDSPLWPAFKELNREVAEISKFILNGESLGFAEWSSPKIHSAIWTYEGVTYMMAVNATAEKVDGTLAKVKAKFTEVLFENRKISTVDGVLKDTFKPYERHVYKFVE